MSYFKRIHYHASRAGFTHSAVKRDNFKERQSCAHYRGLKSCWKCAEVKTCEKLHLRRE